MEILQTDDKLREEIINDAKTKAERIVKKAERDAADINKGLDKQIEEMQDQYTTGMQKEIDEAVALYFASIDIEAKKQIIAESGVLVDSVYAELKDMIMQGAIKPYKEFISKLLIGASKKMKSDSYIIETNEAELQRVSEQELMKLSLEGGVVKDVFTTDVSEGFMLYTADRKLTSHISIDNFITQLKKVTRTKTYEILIKGN